MPSGKTNCFIDTNLLVYAVDPKEPEKRRQAAALLRQTISDRSLVLSPQSLNECYRVLTDKRSLMPRQDARQFVSAFRRFCIAPVGPGVTQQAWHIQDRHGFGWWDCLLLASASSAGCDVFFSEDLRHETKMEALLIVSPFEADFRTYLKA